MSGNESQKIVEIVNQSAEGDLVLVCEHASNRIPQEFNDLGLNEEARQSHIAWDPGADGVSRQISANLDSTLVSSRISRLVYDCNRAPDAHDAIPARSEIYEIPGNQGLTDAQRRQRYQDYYLPFEDALSDYANCATGHKSLVTIHSFTPVYHGKPRRLEIGLIHDQDPRLAEQMFELATEFCDLSVALNQPYSMKDGTTHTLNHHGTRNQMANLMIEVRNDLIASESDQVKIANLISDWLSAALTKIK